MKSLTTITIVILLALLFTSCQIRAPHVKGYYNLINEQTVFIETVDVARAAGCTEKGLPLGARSEVCEALLASLPDIHGRYVGSGTFIQHEGRIRVLTAEHVCFPDEVPDKVERESVTIYVEKSSEISVASGNFRTKATIIKKDKKLDLCILELSEQPLIRTPRFSLYSPARGDFVFYGGAPYGMISEKFLLTYDGYYSGELGENMIFSLPCASGASGSSIRNAKNEIISMVQKVHTGFNYICYGISTEALREFVFGNVTKEVLEK